MIASGDDSNRVLIIGGGLAGLVLANVLDYNGVPYKVFERDAAADGRFQGWSLSMHFVLPKLSKLIDPAKWATFPERTAVNPADPHNVGFALVDGVSGDVWFENKNISNGSDIYRVNRRRLRAWLLDGIDVAWGKQIDHYTVTEANGGGVKVVFKDGTEEHGRVLVGADGANSTVAQQKLGKDVFDRETKVHPVKVFGTQTTVDLALRKRLEAIASAFMMAFGQSPFGPEGTIPCVFSSLADINPDNTFEMQWSASIIDDTLELADTDAGRLQQAKDLARKGKFAGPIGDMIHNTPDGSPVLGLKLRERWPSKSLEAYPTDTVALVGDAVHVMTMFRGEGGNHAMMDSLVLGEQLIKAYKDEISVQEAIHIYHKNMIPRGREAVQESHDAAFTFHESRDGIEALLQNVIKRHEDLRAQDNQPSS